MSFVYRVIVSWLPLAAAITVVFLTIYTAVQQNYRQSLNDPQIQMAEDAATQLSAGTKPIEIIPKPDTVDIVTSLAPWFAIYNNDGVSIVSSGILDGAIPQPPQGVFEAARKSIGKDTDQPNENRVTWQSAAGVRQAIVIVHYNSQNDGGFIVAGRNMREVENRIENLSIMVLLGWLATMGASLFFTGIKVYSFGKMMEHGRS